MVLPTKPAKTEIPESHVYGNLENILASFRSEDGYAEPNKFEAIISPPKLLMNYFGLKTISLRIESISLPGRNLNTLTDSNIYGPTREIVNGVTYAEDISVTFQASADLRERRFFEEWQNQAINVATWDIGYYDNYTGIIEIYIIDRKNVRRYGLKLHEAFPKTIAATSLSGAAKSEIIKNEISFAFRYWTPIDLVQSEEWAHSVDAQRNYWKHQHRLRSVMQKTTNMPAVLRMLDNV